ncbi:MAG: peroxiredoxin [Methylobacter sp.]|nr:MAG: peroxiredoxin [Methylobacter sp.]
MPDYRLLEVGDPAPRFRQACTSNPNYHFDTVAGRYIVLCFFGTGRDERGRNMLKIIDEHRTLFDDDHIAFFGISIDPNDEKEQMGSESMPGIRHFWDFDGSVSRLYGAIPMDVQQGEVVLNRLWIVLNPTLQIRAIFPALADGSDRHRVADYLKLLPPVNSFCGFPVQAPVLVVPNVFEAGFCRHLISLYEAHGGEDSGFMQDVGGKTTTVFDYRHKRRSDFDLEDEGLMARIQRKVIRRANPEIKKAYQFHATRMERYLVACYHAENGDHFRPHRDDTTKGTAHRKFALSILLNKDFDGGELSFPEYGSQTFKAPVGGAVVFSCSLLHTVSPVTRGCRYVFLPFLYDEAAAALREANTPFLDEKGGLYRKDGGKEVS